MSVVTMRGKLTDADVRMLVKGASEDDRAAAAHKLARAIDHAELSPEDRKSAQDILRFVAADAAERVRRALAVALRQSPLLPPDVAAALARDVESVALPILEHSPALSDRDLVEILRSAGPQRQYAIAGRPNLSLVVTATLTEVGTGEAIERALANDNALFDEQGLKRAIDRFPERETMLDTMTRRRTLPVGVVERLVALVSGEVFDHLVNAHGLPPHVAIDLATGARERATIDLVHQAGLQGDLRAFAEQLNLAGRLTPSFLMRALCVGHIRFLEHAMAELAGLNHARTWRLLHDSGPHGLRTLFERAGLPPKLFPVFRAGLDVFHQIEREAGGFDPDAMRARMIERALTSFRSVPPDDLEYLLEKLDAIHETGGRAAAP